MGNLSTNLNAQRARTLYLDAEGNEQKVETTRETGESDLALFERHAQDILESLAEHPLGS